MMKTMTAAQLIEKLQRDCAPEDLVVFASDYGDRSHTQQAHAIRGAMECGRLRETAYSGSGYAVVFEDDEDRFAALAEDRTVVVIS